MSRLFEDTILQGILEYKAIDSEIPKYKKKKQSSTSKSILKTKHKHEYIECLFVKDGCPHRGTYCNICGKIGDMGFFETVKIDNDMYRAMYSDEIFEKYKHLEQIQIEDVFQKFVPVSKEKNYDRRTET